MVFLGPMPPTREMMKQRFDQVNQKTDFYKRLAEMRKEMPTASDPNRVCRAMFAEYLKPYFVDETAMTRRRGSSCDAPAEGVRNHQVVNDATIASLGDWNFLPLLQKVVVPTLVIEDAESTPTIESVFAWASALPDNHLVLVPDAFFPVVESFLARR